MPKRWLWVILAMVTIAVIMLALWWPVWVTPAPQARRHLAALRRALLKGSLPALSFRATDERRSE
jgi:hypothetical protein